MDLGEFSMINHMRFCLDMIHKYEMEYSEMPTDILVDIIDVVLNRAPTLYFSYQQVQDHPEFCNKCGNCCIDLDCEYFDGKICNEYESRFDSCREFPSYEILNETGLMLDCDCHFAKKMAEMALDKEFKRNYELLSLE